MRVDWGAGQRQGETTIRGLPLLPSASNRPRPMGKCRRVGGVVARRSRAPISSPNVIRHGPAPLETQEDRVWHFHVVVVTKFDNRTGTTSSKVSHPLTPCYLFTINLVSQPIMKSTLTYHEPRPYGNNTDAIVFRHPHNKYSFPMYSVEGSGDERFIREQAALYYQSGWDVIVKTGKVFRLRATINVPIGGENGITPQASQSLFLKMGSYKEISE
jgi:hypothetical protein